MQRWLNDARDHASTNRRAGRAIVYRLPAPQDAQHAEAIMAPFDRSVRQNLHRPRVTQFFGRMMARLGSGGGNVFENIQFAINSESPDG